MKRKELSSHRPIQREQINNVKFEYVSFERYGNGVKLKCFSGPQDHIPNPRMDITISAVRTVVARKNACGTSILQIFMDGDESGEKFAECPYGGLRMFTIIKN